MKANPNKVKLILFLAISALVLLLVLNVALIISIHSKNKELNKQNSIIQQQEQMLEYYNQQNQQ